MSTIPDMLTSLREHQTRLFIVESNRIEGIIRNAKHSEVTEFDRFMALNEVTVEDLCKFVTVYQRGAVLRVKPGRNVRVGNHRPPPSGPHIRTALETILAAANSMKRSIIDPKGISAGAYDIHIAYEYLHPFTDGNGRSGRMLWAWQMQIINLGFLHKFYYQTLDATASQRVCQTQQNMPVWPLWQNALKEPSSAVKPESADPASPPPPN